MRMLKVLVYEPGKVGQVVTVPNRLESLQTIVGGYIEAALQFPPLVVVCNEEGLLLRLPENRHKIRGTFFVARAQGEHFTSLTDVLITKAKELFGD